ncbi:hemerythrin domain-containing protein [Piscinibacter sp.]|uniref:hemerythrin domain-containing protein n=1 Tax=Piscinibacter sp. TaxID=1903157 RepID=UPI0039E4592E
MASATARRAAGADFEALAACHRQIAAHLERLGALLEHLAERGVDAHARHEARAIEAFFSSTSQRHHADEEAQVFPALLASSDEALVATVRMLQQDHGWIEEDWLALAPQLSAIAAGHDWHDPAELRHGVEVFLELYREHLALEESLVYPEAKAFAAKLARRRVTAETPSFS